MGNDPLPPRTVAFCYRMEQEVLSRLKATGVYAESLSTLIKHATPIVVEAHDQKGHSRPYEKHLTFTDDGGTYASCTMASDPVYIVSLSQRLLPPSLLRIC